jgi:hypothetical protein
LNRDRDDIFDNLELFGLMGGFICEIEGLSDVREERSVNGLVCTLSGD